MIRKPTITPAGVETMIDAAKYDMDKRFRKIEEALFGAGEPNSSLRMWDNGALKNIERLQNRLSRLVNRYEETHRLLEREGYRIVEDVWIKPSEITSGALDLAMIHRDHGRKIYEQEAVAKGRNLET